MGPQRTRSVAGLAAALAVIGFLVGCGKVPPADQVFVDTKAERKKSTCLAWSYGRPRQTLAEAAAGGPDQKALAEFLSPGWRDEDPDELKDAYAAIHDAARRLREGERAEQVLADVEPALAATDRYFDATCPAIIAADRTATTPSR